MRAKGRDRADLAVACTLAELGGALCTEPDSDGGDVADGTEPVREQPGYLDAGTEALGLDPNSALGRGQRTATPDAQAGDDPTT